MGTPVVKNYQTFRLTVGYIELDLSLFLKLCEIENGVKIFLSLLDDYFENVIDYSGLYLYYIDHQFQNAS